MLNRCVEYACIITHAVEPLTKDTFGTSHFVLCREVNCTVILYRVYNYTRVLSAWEVVGRFVLFWSVLY